MKKFSLFILTMFVVSCSSLKTDTASTGKGVSIYGDPKLLAHIDEQGVVSLQNGASYEEALIQAVLAYKALEEKCVVKPVVKPSPKAPASAKKEK